MNILIIESDKLISDRLKKSFSLHSYDIDIVFDPISAIDKLVTGERVYGLVVLDLDVSKNLAESVKFCAEVRAKGINVPILMVSDEKDIVERMEILDGGATDYIVKPFSFAELANKVKMILGKDDKDISINNKFKLDIVNKNLHINGEFINLTTKEFSILEYLMNNINNFVSREMIFENVWPFDSRATSNIIDVHIKNLRKKMGEHMGDSIIETKWGSGYRFYIK